MGEIYVVWSNEHSAWWGPDRRGYNTHLTHAGRYTRDEALWICTRARGGREFHSNPTEVPVPLRDAEQFWPDADLEAQHRFFAEQRKIEARREEREMAEWEASHD
ncbi:hypothetical protein ACT6QG_05490 [Xanthobacter sp. TB0136]|uniref:hypothetical protein n=1 Tax=Xanthobacter sp. TB0136 TaxID=3459177 RepID=UPI00403A03D6